MSEKPTKQIIMLPKEHIREIARINALDVETTREYLQLTGDHPSLDQTGKFVVLSADGSVLARLQWPEDVKN